MYRVVLKFPFKSDKVVSSIKGVLQFGIRAKVLTLSLDGPVEWSLDRE